MSALRLERCPLGIQERPASKRPPNVPKPSFGRICSSTADNLQEHRYCPCGVFCGTSYWPCETIEVVGCSLSAEPRPRIDLLGVSYSCVIADIKRPRCGCGGTPLVHHPAYAGRTETNVVQRAWTAKGKRLYAVLHSYALTRADRIGRDRCGIYRYIARFCPSNGLIIDL